MNTEQIEDRFNSIDGRLERIELFLPTLASKDELQGAIQPLATREELQEAIRPLATREELQDAIRPLATRDEMHAAIKAEGERARHHATMLNEDTRDDIRIVLEHLVALSERVDALARR